MGIRSEVHLTVDQKGFELIKAAEDGSPWEIISDADQHLEAEGFHYFHWEYVKWYDCDKGVAVLMNLLYDSEFSYRFVKMSYEGGSDEHFRGEESPFNFWLTCRVDTDFPENYVEHA